MDPDLNIFEISFERAGLRRILSINTRILIDIFCEAYGVA